MPEEPPQPAEQPSRPVAEGWHSTTYGRPARRAPRRPDQHAGERPAAQAPGREQRLAELRRPAPRHPQQPRPAAQPAPRPASPRPPAGSAPRRRPHVRRRRLLAAAALVVVLVVVYPFALGWRGWSSVHQVAATAGGQRPAATPGTTFLIVGSDSRDGLSQEEIAEYSAGGDDISGQRTDTIMLLHVPDGGGPAVLVSIPRDSYVPIPGHDSNKINAAFSIGGAPLLLETVEQVSGLRVDHYVETGFGGFAQVVDAVGGVEMCPAQAVDDVRAGLDIPAGCQTMDGRTALGYARYRYSDVLGDLGRANRQRELLAAIVAKASSPAALLNPFRAFPLASAGGGAVTLDEGASVLDLVTFLRGMRAATSTDGISMTVPVADTALRTRHGVAVKWNTEQALEMFDDLKRDDTEALRTLTAS
ncbi:LCP family protein [Kineococcus sp. SYSU DK006]|uniref:LCP family protein n=1 Tax=Kineococcus sp. SYSU DK006 TaxID=3383127 RepID=UPI003D7E10CD